MPKEERDDILDVGSQKVEYGQQDITIFEEGLRRERALGKRLGEESVRYTRAEITFAVSRNAALMNASKGKPFQNVLSEQIAAIDAQVNEEDYVKAGKYKELAAARQEQTRLLNHFKGIGLQLTNPQIEPPEEEERKVSAPRINPQLSGLDQELEEQLSTEIKTNNARLAEIDTLLAPVTREEQAAGSRRILTDQEREALTNFRTNLQEQQGIFLSMQQDHEHDKQQRDMQALAGASRKVYVDTHAEVSKEEVQRFQDAALAAVEIGQQRPEAKWTPELYEVNVAPALAMRRAAHERHEIAKDQIIAESKENDLFTKWQKANYARGEDRTEEILSDPDRDGKIGAIHLPENAIVEVRRAGRGSLESTRGYEVTIKAENYLEQNPDFKAVILKNVSPEQLATLTFKTADTGTNRFYYAHEQTLDVALHVEGRNVDAHTRNTRLTLNTVDTLSGVEKGKAEQWSTYGAPLSPEDKAKEMAAKAAQDAIDRADRKAAFEAKQAEEEAKRQARRQNAPPPQPKQREILPVGIQGPLPGRWRVDATPPGESSVDKARKAMELAAAYRKEYGSQALAGGEEISRERLTGRDAINPTHVAAVDPADKDKGIGN